MLDIPAPLSTYYETLAAVCADFALIADTYDAAKALADFVDGTDYDSLNNIAAVDGYIQALARLYGDFDAALKALNGGISEAAKGAINHALATIIDPYLADVNVALTELYNELSAQIGSYETSNPWLYGLLQGQLDARFGELQSLLSGFDTLDNIVDASAQIRIALDEIAGFSTFLKNLADQVFGQISDIDFENLLDAILDKVPDIEIVAQGSTIYGPGDAVQFTTSADWLLDLLKAAGIDSSLNFVFSADDENTIFDLATNGKLTLKDGKDNAYSNGDYTVKVALDFSAGDAVNEKLAKIFKGGEATVKVRLPLDKDSLNTAYADGTALAGKADKAIAKAEATLNAIKRDKLTPYQQGVYDQYTADLEAAIYARGAATTGLGKALADAVEALSNAVNQQEIDDALTALEAAIAEVADAIRDFVDYESDLALDYSKLQADAFEVSDNISFWIGDLVNPAVEEITDWDANGNVPATVDMTIAQSDAMTAYKDAADALRVAAGGNISGPFTAARDLLTGGADNQEAIDNADAALKAMIDAAKEARAIFDAAQKAFHDIVGLDYSELDEAIGAYDSKLENAADVIDPPDGENLYGRISSIDRDSLSDSAKAALDQWLAAAREFEDLSTYSFYDALEAAKDARNSATTQGEIDAAAAALQKAYDDADEALAALEAAEKLFETISGKDKLHEKIIAGLSKSKVANVVIDAAEKAIENLRNGGGLSADQLTALGEYEAYLNNDYKNALATLDAAIEAGLVVLKDADATPDQIKDARKAIKEAIDALDEAYAELQAKLAAYGDVLNYDALMELLEASEAKLFEAGDNIELPDGKYIWDEFDAIDEDSLSAEQKEALADYKAAATALDDETIPLSAAIASAQDALRDAVTQDEVDQAAADLQAAVDSMNAKLAAFYEAQAAYSEATNKDALWAAMNRGIAKGITAGNIIFADDKEIKDIEAALAADEGSLSEAQKSALADYEDALAEAVAAYEALESALRDAQAALKDPSAAQEDIDNAAAAIVTEIGELEAAMAALDAAKAKFGATPNKDALEAKKVEAETALAASETAAGDAEDFIGNAGTGLSSEQAESLAAVAEALEALKEANSALQEAIENAETVIYGDDVTQADVDKAAKDLEDAMKAAADAAAALETAKESFGGARLDPAVKADADAGIAYIYKGDALPTAPTGYYEQDGTYAWAADAKATVEAADEGSYPYDVTANVVFTPSDTDLYLGATFQATITVLDKTALDDAIKEANGLLKWAEKNIGTSEGKISQAAYDAMSAAIDAAKEVAEKTASENTQEAIDAALQALQEALDALGITPVRPPADNTQQQTPPTGTPAVTTPAADTPPAAALPNVTKIRTPLTKVALTKGKSYKIPFVLDTTLGKTISDPQLSVASSNAKVVKVIKKGAKFSFKAVKAGKATITIKAQNGKKATIKVTVLKKKTALKKFKVKLPKKLKKGKSYQIKIYGLTKNATDISTVTFKSSKKSVATVDAAGKITVLKKGKVKITIKVGKKKMVKSFTIK
jgi:hypothetical protein